MKRLMYVSAAVILGLWLSSCKEDEPTAQQQGPQLTANPASATVGVGTSQNVSIGGGTPPYDIMSPPSAIATATLLDRDSLVAILRITGVTIASTATSVTIKDNSPPPVRTVNVRISVH